MTYGVRLRKELSREGKLRVVIAITFLMGVLASYSSFNSLRHGLIPGLLGVTYVFLITVFFLEYTLNLLLDFLV